MASNEALLAIAIAHGKASNTQRWWVVAPRRGGAPPGAALLLHVILLFWVQNLLGTVSARSHRSGGA